MSSLTDFPKVLAEFQKTFSFDQTTFSFDQKAFEDGVKSVVTFAERLSGITLDAATKSNEITSRSVSESIANLRTLTTARKEAFEYGKAFTDFAQSQFDLAVRAAGEFGDLAKWAQTSTTDLVTETPAPAKQPVKQPAKQKAVAVADAAVETPAKGTETAA